MNDWEEPLKIAFVLIIVVTVIGFVLSTAMQMSDESIYVNNISRANIYSAEEKNFIKYSNNYINGAEAVSFIIRHRLDKNIGIIVNNGSKEKTYIRDIKIIDDLAEYDNDAEIDSIGKISNSDCKDNYIKPSDIYLSEIFRNNSGEIICLKFVKQ